VEAVAEAAVPPEDRQDPGRLGHEHCESVEPVGTGLAIDPVEQAIEPARCVWPLADLAKSSLDGRVLRGLLRLSAAPASARNLRPPPGSEGPDRAQHLPAIPGLRASETKPTHDNA